MKIIFDDGAVLDLLSQKYLQDYFNNGGRNELAAGTHVHLFWKEMEKKFNFKIDWTEYVVKFNDEKDYLAFVLKEL